MGFTAGTDGFYHVLTQALSDIGVSGPVDNCGVVQLDEVVDECLVQDGEVPDTDVWSKFSCFVE